MQGVLVKVTIAAIAVGIFSLLLPERYKKQGNFLSVCFFIAAVVFAVGSAEVPTVKQLSETLSRENSYVDYSQASIEAQQKTVGGVILPILRDKLELAGITPDKIYAVVNISSMGVINISQIRVDMQGAPGDYPLNTGAVIVKTIQGQLGNFTEVLVRYASD